MLEHVHHRLLHFFVFLSLIKDLGTKNEVTAAGLRSLESSRSDLDFPFESSDFRHPVQDWNGLRRIFDKSNANPASDLTTPEVIRLYDYPVECHKIQTEDGYMLTLHRIPHPKGQSPPIKANRPVVFLQHGLFASSFEWLMNTPDKLLALQLVDAGYDVWLGNVRGNAYSRGHIKLSVEKQDFWEFSMHEMGKFDLPASIDYILNVTNVEKLSFVGFSMGSTMFWIMMSLRPEYNDKVHIIIALAPVVYLNNMKGFPKFLLAPFYKPLKKLLDFLFHGEFLPPWLLRIYNFVGTKLCSNTFIAESFCANINFLYAGWDLPQTQFRQLPLFYSHTPSPTSTRTLTHIAQFINRGDFEEYDFGEAENVEKYGRPFPSKYSLRKSSVPVALLYGLNDAVVEPIDVSRLASELPNIIFKQPVNFSLWNHFDYHLARDVNTLINEPIKKLLSKFTPTY